LSALISISPTSWGLSPSTYTAIATTPVTATTSRISRSVSPPVSLTMTAPASTAAMATSGFQVSIATRCSSAASASMIGTTLEISSAVSMVGLSKCDDCPPRSIRVAPHARYRSAISSASSTELAMVCTFFESGEALITPIT
jgi:hypothetical protein